jgi:signal transduction histidine kinase
MSYSIMSLGPGPELATPVLPGRLHAPRIVFTRREAYDARAEEVAVICHELRNSLAVVRGAARLMRVPDNAQANSARSLIERHVAQMSRHIEDLQQPLRRDVPNHGFQLSDLDLRVVARHAADAIGPEMERRAHRLAIQLPGEPVWVHADAARLEQVLSNLLINAAKYTPDSGDIALTLEHENDQARLRIRDSGVGIEPRMLPRIFGMFFQVGATLPGARGGHGIGLAVVRNIVEQHGGTVTAMSAGLGLGTEFTVALPARRAKPDPVILTP